MIFLKAGSSLVEAEKSFRLPSFTRDIHHEVEVALRFGPGLEFTEITIALDLTAREVQNKLKNLGHPWTLAKSFQASCPIGPLRPLPKTLNLKTIDFSLKVNGQLRQKGNTSDMIFDAQNLRSYLLERFPVVEGDLLLTGTPAGVGPVRPGDILEAEIAGLLKTTWQVEP
jgi:acylpyruvate hydrolase